MMNDRSISFVRIMGILLILLSVGCQENQQATVSGSVTLDGEILDHGTVFFVAGSKNKSEAAAGGIQSDGTYRVQIGQSGNLWSGEYAVEVTASEPSIPHPEGGPPTPGALITPERYASTATSGLRYNIRSGENTIDIVLASDSPAAAGEPTADEGQAEEQAQEAAATVESEVSEETVKDAQETTVEEPSEENAEAPAE